MAYSILNSVFALTFLLAGSETIAMTSLQQYVKKDFDLKYLLVAIVTYGLIIPYIVVKTLNYDGIGTVNLMWNIITTVTMIVVGYYIFSERITHLHIISLMLGVASIVLLSMAGDNK